MNPNPEIPANGSRKKALLITTSILLSISVLLFLYWLLHARFYVYTDDAYVNGNYITISPQVRGIITDITIDNTQLIEKGKQVISLDKTEATIHLKKAQDELANSVRNVIQMFQQVKQLEALLQKDQAILDQAKLDYNHRKALIASRAVSLEDFEHSETHLKASISQRNYTLYRLIAAKALVENTTPSTHPLVEKAKDAVRKAYLTLVRSDIYAPVTGIVTQRNAQVGSWVNPGDPLFAIIPLDQIWVDANYKETQLKHLRIGQSVNLHADMYGHEITFRGKVVGQNPGTGSIFSVLPPQNATGNWIKIVQRVPVRIRLDAEEIAKHPLWLGLSMEVTTDVHDKTGPLVANAQPLEVLYQTDIFEDQLEGVEMLIDSILTENTSCETLSPTQEGPCSTSP